jgi:hypothetical protein
MTRQQNWCEPLMVLCEREAVEWSVASVIIGVDEHLRSGVSNP